MAERSVGARTWALPSRPVIAGAANAAGRKEGEGPLKDTFDAVCPDDTFGQSSWEKSESEMQRLALTGALARAGISPERLSALFAGDLLNQCIGSSFAARTLGAPYLGLYGACSTMGEALTLAALTVDGGYGDWAAAAASRPAWTS